MQTNIEDRSRIIKRQQREAVHSCEVLGQFDFVTSFGVFVESERDERKDTF